MNEYLLLPLFFVIGLWVGLRSFGRLLDFVTEKGSGRGVQVGPWKTHPGVGRRNTPLIEKAAIARIGLGANDSEETIYWNAFTDSQGRELRAEHDYRVVFRSAPPVRYSEKGFWSITVYGKDKFLIPNQRKKYMIRGDERNNPLKDLHFSIFLSRKTPEITDNWIPLPAGNEKFSLAYRCYRPAADMKENLKAVCMPEIIKC